MPDDAPVAVPASQVAAKAVRGAVRAKHAASLLVVRMDGDEPCILMGMRGAKHRFMPNRLVFPGGRVDAADYRAASASPLAPKTEWALRKRANPALARALGHAAARELQEETGLTLGSPPHLRPLEYLARAVTPPSLPIRYNARFLVVSADHVHGALGGDGELEGLRFYGMDEALALNLALPTRLVLAQLKVFIALSPAERAARTHTPVLLRDRGWVPE
ncbi:MAG TPA: NUDIX hydrolase [Rhodopila sp.]|uniref:NUDIX hydrolase n=1 Tax=Rhodopila sp. TaxID=2480087 RepID=UPI002D180905|nr:NUDIX hydrolase [Rhodopila sp.]HVY17385.1 NUDIX hydrolase [Rhodopila sp.]